MERCHQPLERVNVSSTGVGGSVTVVDDVTMSSGPTNEEVSPTPGEGECE